MYKVVHVKTQEEADSVYNILDRKIYSEMIRAHGECIIYFDNHSGFDKIISFSANKHLLYTYEQFLELKGITIKTNNKSMEKQMLDVLSKTYDNPILRRTTVPLFMGNPGIGKTKIIESFAKSRGVKVTKIILSTRMPNEVLGMTMPDLVKDRMVLLDNHQLSELQDGEILFFDEVFNGTLKQTLDSFLNFLEDRKLISGKKLADVMIIAASNPQGLINLTPQIKQRFEKEDLKFNAEEYQNYLKNKYGTPESISSGICTLINKEKFESNEWNFITPRSVEKALNKIGCDLVSNYDDLLLPLLKKTIEAPLDIVKLGVKKGDQVEYLSILKLLVKETNEEIKNPKNKIKNQTKDDSKNRKQESGVTANIPN